jgi:predicted ATPase
VTHTLRSIKLGNFKSIDEATVKLAPVTVVVGSNSSGKSSLIQSLMLLVQASQQRYNPGLVNLKGDRVSLGRFDEIRNFHFPERNSLSIALAFDVVETDGPETPSEHEWNFTLSPSHLATSARLDSIGIEIDPPRIEDYRYSGTLELNGEPDAVRALGVSGLGLEPIMYSKEFVAVDGEILSDAEDVTPSAIVLRGLNIDRVMKQSELSQILGVKLLSLIYSGSLLREFLNPERDTELNEAFAEHFRASSGNELSGSEEMLSEWARAAKFAIEEIADGLAYDDRAELFDEIAQQGGDIAAFDRAEVWADAFRIYATSESPDFEHAFKSMSGVLRNARDFDDWLEGSFLVGLREVTGFAASTLLAPLDQPHRENIISASTNLEKFLSTSVQYLGPIRVEPERLYGFSSDSTGVGVRGELTASVLLERGHDVISYPDTEGNLLTGTLMSAVAYWVSQIEIGESVKVDDFGGHGVEIRVRPMGSDLSVLPTALGVGVSQVLPVIVLGLIADVHDLIVIEQPELHLHPRMQGRLGEFFWALSKFGKRILIETHSEHIVNRLRAVIAETDGDESWRLGLVFAEQENGITQYRQPSVDEFGMLSEDWPAGFLDITPEESRRILRAAIAKQEN